MKISGRAERFYVRATSAHNNLTTARPPRYEFYLRATSALWILPPRDLRAMNFTSARPPRYEFYLRTGCISYSSYLFFFIGNSIFDQSLGVAWLLIVLENSLPTELPIKKCLVHTTSGRISLWMHLSGFRGLPIHYACKREYFPRQNLTGLSTNRGQIESYANRGKVQMWGVG